MTSKQTPEQTPTRDRHAAWLALGALGLAATAKYGIPAAQNFLDTTQDKMQVIGEMHTFTSPDIMTQYKDKGYREGTGSDARDVTVRTVPAGVANPTELAKLWDAKDVTVVALEISGQVGGDHSMNPGEQVVLPNDQINPEHTTG